MNLIAQLQRSNLDPKAVSVLLATLEQHQLAATQLQQRSDELAQLNVRVQRDAAYIKAADTKIAALTLELAHHRRLRFANKSEAFSPAQRELFEETWNVDLAAIEAEADRLVVQVLGGMVTGVASGKAGVTTRRKGNHKQDGLSWVVSWVVPWGILRQRIAVSQPGYERTNAKNCVCEFFHFRPPRLATRGISLTGRAHRPSEIT